MFIPPGPPIFRLLLTAGGGIAIVGAILAILVDGGEISKYIGLAALICATINVVGGFLVTDRMLKMFKKK